MLSRDGISAIRLPGAHRRRRLRSMQMYFYLDWRRSHAGTLVGAVARTRSTCRAAAARRLAAAPAARLETRRPSPDPSRRCAARLAAARPPREAAHTARASGPGGDAGQQLRQLAPTARAAAAASSLAAVEAEATPRGRPADPSAPAAAAAAAAAAATGGDATVAAGAKPWARASQRRRARRPRGAGPTPPSARAGDRRVPPSRPSRRARRRLTAARPPRRRPGRCQTRRVVRRPTNSIAYVSGD